jgi:NADH-quinone oxidoreductase subunit E
MSVRRLAPPEHQPKEFAFTPENSSWAKRQIAKFPEGRQQSAVIPLLWRAQEQSSGWLPQKAIEHIADILGMAKIRVLEVATFYTMFNLEPVGKFHVQLCTTTPCMLRGSDELQKICHRRIGEPHHVTTDGKFSWLEVECLGACVNAPMAQINHDYYEDLSPESFEKILDEMAAGRTPKPGPQIAREMSAPVGGRTTLNDPAIDEDKTRPVAAKIVEPDSVAAPEPSPEAKSEPVVAPDPVTGPGATPESVSKASPAPEAAPESTAVSEPISEAAPELKLEPQPQTPQIPPTATAEEPVSDEYKPELLSKAREGEPDDLKLIWGVGPKLEAMLHGMGVFHFDQIAAWTDMNLRWVDQNLTGFKGRAVRDKWVEQSAKLATGWRPSHGVGDKPQE